MGVLCASLLLPNTLAYVFPSWRGCVWVCAVCMFADQWLIARAIRERHCARHTPGIVLGPNALNVYAQQSVGGFVTAGLTVGAEQRAVDTPTPPRPKRTLVVSSSRYWACAVIPMQAMSLCLYIGVAVPGAPAADRTCCIRGAFATAAGILWGHSKGQSTGCLSNRVSGVQLQCPIHRYRVTSPPPLFRSRPNLCLIAVAPQPPACENNTPVRTILGVVSATFGAKEFSGSFFWLSVKIKFVL